MNPLRIGNSGDTSQIGGTEAPKSTKSTDGRVVLSQPKSKALTKYGSGQNMGSSTRVSTHQAMVAVPGMGMGTDPKKLEALNKQFTEITADYKEVSKQAPSKEKWLSFFGKVLSFITFGRSTLGKNLSESSKKLHAQMDRLEGQVKQMQDTFERKDLNPLELRQLKQDAEKLFNELQELHGALTKGLKATYKYEKERTEEGMTTKTDTKQMHKTSQQDPLLQQLKARKKEE